MRTDTLEMKRVLSPNDIDECEEGVQYFQFSWSSTQQAAQSLFNSCIETGDPNSLFQLLAQYPYHVTNYITYSTTYQ